MYHRGMDLDNETNAPFLYSSIPTEGSIRIQWNATKGRDEYLRVKYVEDNGGIIISKRTRRTAVLYVRSLFLGAFTNINYLAEWSWQGRAIYMLADKHYWTIRYEPFDESLI